MRPEITKFAVGLILSLIGVVHGKPIANSRFEGITKFRRSPHLAVHSQGYGSGNGNGPSGGMSSTYLQFNNNNNPDSRVKVQSNAIGVGNGNGGGSTSTTYLEFNNDAPCDDSKADNDGLRVQSSAYGSGSGDGGAMSSTDLQFNSGGESNRKLSVESNADGYGSENGAGMSNTFLEFSNGSSCDNANNGEDAHETVDVNTSSLGTGNTAYTTSDTHLQRMDNEGKETTVDTTSFGYGSGSDDVAASNTSVKIDDNELAFDDDGAINMSNNFHHIEDDEGNIDLRSLAAGSRHNGGSGASSIGINMADGEDEMINNDLEVKSSNQAIGSSDQAMGGSISTVQVDDRKNERSIQAETAGFGYSNNNSSGTLTTDSMKYHDVDREEQQVVNPENGTTLKSSTHETNDISSQNMHSQHESIDDDGTFRTTTHSSASQTKKNQVKQQSYTQHQNINQQNQDYISDQQIDQNQTTLLAQQSQNTARTQEVNQTQDSLTSYLPGYFFNGQDSTLVQEQTQTAQMTSTQETRSTQQAQQHENIDDDDDGGTSRSATHSYTSQTKRTQVAQQSYTKHQIINQQNQDYISDQQIGQNQTTLLDQQSQNTARTQEVNQTQDSLTSYLPGYFFNGQDSTLVQEQTQMAQMTSTQETQTTQMSYSQELQTSQKSSTQQVQSMEKNRRSYLGDYFPSYF